ncbi:MAG TPA: PIN domain-containing protein [Candidatus Baltobacteraceae bacterium]|nr:PIN domain-containing protein [Candidatus Baltobacteraceae bacterium]
MKKEFVGYYAPSESEFDELWKNGRVVVDANVLLAIYGVSPSTRETLLRLLGALRNRLWVPHHFALEYQRNRLGKILEQAKHYDDAYRHLKTILDEQFRSSKQHPFVSDEVERRLEEICTYLLEGKAQQEALLASDPYFMRITELFEGNVGAPYNEPDLRQTYEIARKRFLEKIPPGFEDIKKPEPDRYGDYVGWRQILDFAAKNKTSVILVTDDAKEDWWRREGSRTFGPRPELVVEFRGCCSGLFHMYPSDRFLELSGKYIGGPVDPKAISELKERREAEPSSGGIKATRVDVADSLAAKAADYVMPATHEKPVPDIPKSMPEESVKPEEK